LGRGVPVFPVSLDLEGAQVLVLTDGSAEAGAKVDLLVDAGATVHLRHLPWSSGALPVRHRRHPAVVVQSGRFRVSDVKGRRAVLFLSLRGDQLLDEVRRTARIHHVPFYAKDRPADSDFILPAVARCGPLRIAISTAGLAPALGAELRRAFERGFGGRAFQNHVVRLSRQREALLESGLPGPARRRRLRELARLELEIRLRLPRG